MQRAHEVSDHLRGLEIYKAAQSKRVHFITPTALEWAPYPLARLADDVGGPPNGELI